MADYLPSARACNLVSVIPRQTPLWTVDDKVSVHNWLRKRSHPSHGQPRRSPVRKDNLGIDDDAGVSHTNPNNVI